MPKKSVEARRIRLILVDDHALVAQSLSTCLGRQFDIVGIAHDTEGLREILEKTSADCLLLDIEMPGRNGLQFLPWLKRHHPDMRVVLLTMLAEPGLAEAALADGAAGFVTKTEPIENLEIAISEVVAGRRYVSPLPKTSHHLGLRASHNGLHRLTDRQQQIILRIGDGDSLSDIARELGVSPSTITFHKQNAMRILGIDTESALRQYAVLLRTGSRLS